MNNAKKFKRIASIAVLPLAISACGDDSSVDTSSSAQATYTAIDGYLGQAEVYFDHNRNGVADSDELQGSTNSNGVFVGDDSDDDPVIIKIVAGTTTDSDYTGALTENRELVAAAGINTITPFSTIAYLQDMDMSELATELGVSLDEIQGDFIAEGHDEVHVLARSIYQRLDSSLAASESNISNIHSEAQTISQFISNNSTADFSDLIVELDASNNPSFASITDSDSSPVNTQFNFATATVQWEQKDFSAHQYNGSTFHPCYPHKLSDSKIIAGDCMGEYFIVLSATDGSILSSLDISSTPAENWYLDGEVLIVETNNTTYYYDENLSALPSYTPTQSVYWSGDEWNVINNSSETQIDNLQSGFSDHKTTSGMWRSEGVAYRVYYTYDPSRSDGANIYTALVNGTLDTESNITSEPTIQSAVITAHNSSELGSDYTASTSNTSVTYLSQGSFLVRVDTDSTYVSDDYHYMYNDGNVAYLGKFYQGSWYGGLDNSTVTWYTSLRSAKVNGFYPEPHQFKQFALDDGELVGTWEKPHSEFEPVLYRQEHSSLGIVSISDSYSSVSLIK
ncbi:hypothetical protein P7F88_06345 [Vibrio hannami]|uniref:hypothetical protein n=1 Tax=Vibrio hannami TaxID=2717094 RepID=UPI00240EB797|nr:hypothetical protein [Vibrio hannami]MDG3085741.1 hypothetical protein [Vibrio hannami]